MQKCSTGNARSLNKKSGNFRKKMFRLYPSFVYPELNFFLDFSPLWMLKWSTIGNPISGSGAGLRPIGKDPNFVEDLREIFNISIPILHEDDKNETYRTYFTGNGRNKWPNPNLVSSTWREVVSVSVLKKLIIIKPQKCASKFSYNKVFLFFVQLI